MGDIFSSKKQTTSNTVENKQVALQGAPNSGQVGLSGSQIGDNSDITVLSGDPIVALAAIAGMSSAVNVSAVSAVESNKTAQAGLAVTHRGLDVANSSVNAAHQTTTNVLEYLQYITQENNALVGDAVATAENIALRAAPVSPGSYGEIIGQQSVDTNKTLIYAGVAVAVVLAFLILRK